MRTAILAGGIAVVRSGVDYVEDGDEGVDIVLWRLGYRQARQRVEQKKSVHWFQWQLRCSTTHAAFSNPSLPAYSALRHVSQENLKVNDILSKTERIEKTQLA